MRFLRNFKIKLIGFVLIFVYYIPRFSMFILKRSYLNFFSRQSTLLTASPVEHLLRAERMLRWGNRSELLYAALEIRFALERMTQKELIFAKMSSNKMMDEPSP